MINRLILLSICVCLIFPSVLALTYIDTGNADPPKNVVLLIIDGMGSKYICPGSIPTAIDQSPIRHARVPVLEEIISNGVIVPDVRVRVPKTGPAHSVIITGYSKADAETVEFAGATIYDILEDEGFLSIAIMHKGDFAQLRNEQDIILYIDSNSIKEPSLTLQINNNNVPVEIVNELRYLEQKFREYQKDTGGIDSYTAYSDWELDASEHIVSLMAQHYPKNRYILTVNIGVVDCAGHYRGVEGYIESIEGVDNALQPLFTAASRSSTSLIITADHGMAFKSANASRGGHASEDYFCTEAITVPLIMISQNIIPGTIFRECNQQDMALTILSILDIPHKPKYADGENIHVKKYVNLLITSDVKADVEIIQGMETISCGTGDSTYYFTGLKPEINYIIRISNGNEILEKMIKPDIDSLIEFNSTVPYDDEKEWNNTLWRRRIASVLILLVIIMGLFMVNRIKD